MNHLKPKKVSLSPTDSLKIIFETQNKINSKFYKVSTLWKCQKVQWSIKLFVAIVCELVEMINWMPWKWWKSKQDKTNVMEIKYEIVDIVHFLISLALLWGMDAEEFYSLYITKANENLERQENGY